MIAVSWAYLLEPPEEQSEFREASPGACVVGIPGLLHVWEFFFQSSNERQKADTVGCHSQGVALSHSFFTEYERRAFPILASDHEDYKVPITIKGELCT
jgi:hypothetical protein